MSRLIMTASYVAISAMIAGCQNAQHGTVTPQGVKAATSNPVQGPTGGNPGNNPGLPTAPNLPPLTPVTPPTQIDPGAPPPTIAPVSPTGPGGSISPSAPVVTNGPTSIPIHYISGPSPQSPSAPIGDPTSPPAATQPPAATPLKPVGPNGPTSAPAPTSRIPAPSPQNPSAPIGDPTNPPATPPAATQPPAVIPPKPVVPTNNPSATNPPANNPPGQTPPGSTPVLPLPVVPPVVPPVAPPIVPAQPLPPTVGNPLVPGQPINPNSPMFPTTVPYNQIPVGGPSAGWPGNGKVPAFASRAMQAQMNGMGMPMSNLGVPWSQLAPLPIGPTICADNSCPTQQVALPPPPSPEDFTVPQNWPSSNPSAAAPLSVAQNIPGSLAPNVVAGPKPECAPVEMTGKIEHKKLDIVFVWDTSDSMRGGQENGTGGELGMLIPSMDSFTAQLDPSTDVRIGMLLGNARADAQYPSKKLHNSPDWHSKLFQVDASDPAVIDLSKYNPKQVADLLKRKLSNLPKDHTQGQGEALGSSLYDAMALPEYRREIKRQGLLRKDATLLVITVSDEQDVCFDYKKAGLKRPYVYINPTGKKGAGHWDYDEHELAAYADPKICANSTVDHKRLTPNHVYDALVRAKDSDASKVMVLGVHYTKAGVPIEMQDHWSEMEEGHFHEEVIARAHGVVADMKEIHRIGNTDTIAITKLFTYLGKYTQESMQYRSNYPCKSDVHPESINRSRVVVHFDDAIRGNDLVMFSSQCTSAAACAGTPYKGRVDTDLEFDGQGASSGMEVSINPDLLSAVLKNAGFIQGKVRITFDTVSTVDSRTGQRKATTRRKK